MLVHAFLNYCPLKERLETSISDSWWYEECEYQLMGGLS